MDETKDASFRVLPYAGRCPNCGSQFCRVLQYGKGEDINREFECLCGQRLFIGEDNECKGSRSVTLEHVASEIDQEFHVWKNGGKRKQ